MEPLANSIVGTPFPDEAPLPDEAPPVTKMWFQSEPNALPALKVLTHYVVG